MDEKAIRGIPWTIFSYGANRVVSVATTIILARLLVPEDFGLFALATLGTGFISLFSGLGLGNALVLRQDLDRRGQGTILTLLLLAGLAFALVLAALAPLLAEVFREPRLTGVLLVLAGILSFTGFNWFYESILQRDLEFKRRFVTQMVRTIAFSVVALALAATGSGVWALVGAHVAGHIANGIALVWLTPQRVPPAWDRAVAREVLGTGQGFVVQDVAAFLQQNADYMVIGRVLSTGQLGFYTMAYRQAELPHYAVADPVARVTFPSFAAMRHRGEDVMPAFLTGLRLVALVTCPIAVVLSAGAEPFTEALFGDKWLPMIGPLSVLGIWAVIRPLEVTVGNLLNSIGRAGLLGRVTALLLLPLAVAIYVAADTGGITAVAWVLLGHMTLALGILFVLVRRTTGTSVVRQFSALAPLFAASAVSWGATRWVADALDPAAPFVALVAATAVAFAVYGLAVRVLVPPLLGDAVAQVRRAVGRRREAQPAAA